MRVYAASLRSRISHTIHFCEYYVPWPYKLTGLATELDFIAIQTYPMCEYKTVTEAMMYPCENFNAVQSA